MDRSLIERWIPSRCYNTTLAHKTHVGLAVCEGSYVDGLVFLPHWPCKVRHYYHLQAAAKEDDSVVKWLTHSCQTQRWQSRDWTHEGWFQKPCIQWTPVSWEETHSKVQWRMSMLELKEPTEAESFWQGIKRQAPQSTTCQSEQLDLDTGEMESHTGFLLWSTPVHDWALQRRSLSLAVLD